MKGKIVIVSILLIALAVGTTTTVSAASDVSHDWELPADGSNDTSTYYSIDREDTSSAGYINLSAWADNRTVYINFNNVENASVFINATDFDINKYLTALQMVGGDIKIKVQGDESPMNFTFHGIPEFAEAKLDGSSWSTYTYDAGTQQLDCTLTMSTHTITLDYEAFAESIASLLWVIIQLAFVIGLLTFFVDKVKL